MIYFLSYLGCQSEGPSPGFQRLQRERCISTSNDGENEKPAQTESDTPQQLGLMGEGIMVQLIQNHITLQTLHKIPEKFYHKRLIY